MPIPADSKLENRSQQMCPQSTHVNNTSDSVAQKLLCKLFSFFHLDIKTYSIQVSPHG